MSEQNENEQDVVKSRMSRRGFLKTGGVAVGTALLGGVVAGCGDDVTRIVQTTGTTTTTPTTTDSWKTPPATIPDSKISKTVSVDVVVVGGGLAGLCAALSAREEGVEVALLEKWTTGRYGGAYYGAVDSKLMLKQGRKPDKTEILIDYIKENQNNIDAGLISLWLNNSGKVMDWLMEKTDAAGLVTILVSDDGSTNKPAGYDPNENIFDEGVYPGHRVGYDSSNPSTDSNEKALAALQDSARTAGVKLNYQTPGQQLIKDSNGRVTGVIATDKDGNYIKFTATKAVILCTGDYMSNSDMVNEYIPWAADLAKKNVYQMLMNPASTTPLNTGDGHKMAIWAGAAMQGFGHGAMIAGLSLISGPFTWVNSDGERFMNENTTCVAAVATQLMAQKDQTGFQILDSKYAADIERIGVVGYDGIHHVTDATKANVEASATAKANTLEALADLIKVPKDTFIATIKRRNELANNGEDVDFGVVASRMVTVDTPPYYAYKGGLMLLVGFGGILANTKLQALDENHKVVPGLYLAGNTVGRRASNYYMTPQSGATDGSAMTWGYLAGKNAAAEEVSSAKKVSSAKF